MYNSGRHNIEMHDFKGGDAEDIYQGLLRAGAFPIWGWTREPEFVFFGVEETE